MELLARRAERTRRQWRPHSPRGDRASAALAAPGGRHPAAGRDRVGHAHLRL